MRFRIHLLFLSLLHSLSCLAQEPSAMPLRMDQALGNRTNSTEDVPTIIEANQLVTEKEQRFEATGNAELRKRDQLIRAEYLKYNERQIEARENVMLRQTGGTVTGPRLQLNLDTQVGTFEQPKFQLDENNGRGSASVMHIQDKQHYTLDNATYSTCAADDESWQLKMGRLDIDRVQQIGEARQVKVEFQGLPILYVPWMDFSLSNQRKSGLLSPIYGKTVKGGTELTFPFYWNIASNFDATFSPRIMEKRGTVFNNEFRYLQPNYRGELRVDVMPEDRLTDKGRGRVSLQHYQSLPFGGNGYMNLNRVSDNNYFRDLGNAVNSTSQVNLVQEIGFGYAGNWWNSSLRMQQYQTLQDPAAPIVAPYARLPQISLTGQQRFGQISVGLNSEYVDFSHPTLVTGSRLVVNPSVSYHLVNQTWGYLSPKFGLHTTRYRVANVPAQDAARTVPIFSLDSGAVFEREVSFLGKPHQQTLEPRVFYVYIPYRDQAALPNFDAAQADFSFVQMFNENRFFGSDRIGDANHITVALNSRLLDDESGQERLRLTMGQRFSVKSPKVYLVAPTADNNRSDMLFSLEGRVSRAWSLESEWQYDPNRGRDQRLNFAAHYRPDVGKILNIGYRFTRDRLRNVDISTQWPVANKWNMVARWNYSLQDERLLEAIVGLEYHRACWSVRMVGQRFATATSSSSTGFFMQLELNDLLKLGSDPLNLLKQSVYGYSQLNEKNADKK